MYGCKIGLELHKDMGIPLTDQIRLYRQVGFEGFFG